MILLEAINRILPTLGESVVTSIDSRNPTVKIIQNAIHAQTKDMQLREWWFNSFDVDLYPDTNGEIQLPANLLAWIPYDNGGIQRGNRLLNPDTLNFVWPIGKPVRGQIRVLVDFEDLPESAATYVLYEACVKAYVDDIGLEQTVSIWQQKSAQARIMLEAEHLRNRKYTTLKSRRYRRIRNALRG